MARAEDVWFQSAERQLFARVWGSGQPLVLMHGSHLNTHAAFAELAARLDGHFQLVAPDVRGFGRSESPSLASHTWSQYVADVSALLDHLRLRSAIIGGQSFGAGIAIAAALTDPHRTRGIVIAQPAYAGAEIGNTEAQKAVWVRAKALVAEAMSDGLEAAMVRSQTDEAGREWVRKAVTEQQDEQSFLAAHRGEMATFQPFESLEELRSIKVPALLIPGSDPAHDPVVAERYARHLQRPVLARWSGNDPSTWVDDLLHFAPLVTETARAEGRRRR